MNAQNKEKIFVFGASGHAKVVMDIIEKQKLYEIEFLVDDNPTLKSREFFDYPVLGNKEDLLKVKNAPNKAIVSIGSNAIRESIARWLVQNGFELISAVHPSAQLGRGGEIGEGTVVMAQAAINSDTAIGDNVIINTRSSIDHDCRIGNQVHIAPGATLCGGVTVGDGSFICSGATVIPNITVGKNVTVGAGAVVIDDVSDNVTVAGIPARILST